MEVLAKEQEPVPKNIDLKQIFSIQRQTPGQDPNKPVFKVAEQLNYHVKTERLVYRDINGNFVMSEDYEKDPDNLC